MDGSNRWPETGITGFTEPFGFTFTSAKGEMAGDSTAQQLLIIQESTNALLVRGFSSCMHRCRERRDDKV